ncbi:MAG: DHH family phosphoesterase [Desulfurococcales archaeon]|nr:DHH family phosphoesterase [Desulfurococcales archaeon]
MDDNARSIIKRALDSYNRITLVYHWDADGMLSAISLVAYYGSADRVLLEPPRFTYRIDKDYLERLKESSRRSDALIIVDIDYPGDTIDMLAEKLGKHVIVIDHHAKYDLPKREDVTYYNPAAKGDPQGLYPSATHVLAEILEAYHPLLVAASIVGDLGPQAKSNKVYQNYMVEAGLDPVRDYWLIEEAVRLLSSLEIMGNYDGIKWIPKVIGIGDMDPFKAILNDALLATLRVQADAELEEILKNAERNMEEPARGVKAVLLEGEGRHASQLARRLAAKYKDHIVIVGYKANSTGEARVYARTYRTDIVLASLIPKLKARGYLAGGKTQRKNNVVALETTPEKLEDAYNFMVNQIIELIKNMNK